MRASGSSVPARAAEEGVLNLYSARHYQTDEALYDNFIKATGVKINRIEAGDEERGAGIRIDCVRGAGGQLGAITRTGTRM